MESMYMAKVTRSGQISIPKELREEYGVDEGEYMAIEPMGKMLLMRKVESSSEEMFSKLRQEIKERGITKKDVTKALEEAREDVFREQYGL